MRAAETHWLQAVLDKDKSTLNCILSSDFTDSDWIAWTFAPGRGPTESVTRTRIRAPAASGPATQREPAQKPGSFHAQ